MNPLPCPTYHDVLDGANFWRTTADPADLSRAAAILEAGMAEHGYALALGDELALLYQKLGRDDDAWQLLQDLRERHREPGEETLARLAKIAKALAQAKIESKDWTAALDNLRAAEGYYGESYEKRHGFYPRINQLTVRLVRAAVLQTTGDLAASGQLLRDVRAEAAAMLADETVWTPRQPDDAIWIAASRAEAYVLLGSWDNARAAYREALRRAAPRQFFYDCMRDQLFRHLVPAYWMLGRDFDPELLRSEKYFAPVRKERP